MSRRRSRFLYLLFLLIFLSLFGFYKNIQKRADVCTGSRRATWWVPKKTCQRIKKSIIQTPLEKVNAINLMKNVKSLQRCPWSLNTMMLHEVRSELASCCNATGGLLVTQENTRIGDVITYETQSNRQIKITEQIHQMLPQTSPFPDKPFRRCAVVGNGGVLLNSCCGSEIDQADYVFRLNLPPMNYSYDIGTKTDLVTANPSILHNNYSRLDKKRRPFVEMLKAYKSASLLMPAFSFASNTDVSFKVFYALQDFESEQKVLFFHPTYLKNLALHWKGKGLKVRRLSSGLMIVSIALELCDEVSMYGFWPFPQGATGKPIPHHYYDNKLPKPGFHSMSDEFFFYTKMHSMGVLRLKVGRCF
ncbi:alpha-2,8-sialyltransferase 8E-like [Spea bombifrons]|uniref:alpha-2,8-sialyltransferase 8E-like n=1 Tax=Spea bombifrons TaxID=233779 RepID=UPI0023494F11|nr:alpha-2,8-sialyltransferase 8E-like [Spea bombifrons]